MTMVSKYPLNEKIKERVSEIFLDTIAKLRTSQEVDNFLEEFLSPTEKIMLTKRLSIAVLLSKGYDVRRIGKILKVSKNTVVKVNLLIKHKKGFLFNLLEKINQDEKIQEFFATLGYQIEKAAIPLTYGNWSEKRKQIEKERSLKLKPF